MTEYDYSPEALDAYNRTQDRVARWVDHTDAHHHEFRPAFGLRSDCGSEQDDHDHLRPPMPHRRSVSMGPPAAYNPLPSPPGLYAGTPYGHINAPAPNPMPPQMVQMPANYPQYVVSPPPTIVPQGQGSLHRSQSHDNLSHHSKQSHPHHSSHHARRHHGHSPTYMMQTSPTYTPMFSPPLSTGGWFPPQQGYPFPHHATPPRVLSPTPGVPYAYSYATAVPNGVQYPYGFVQQPVQPQPQFIVVRDSKSRKSSKSRKVIYV